MPAVGRRDAVPGVPDRSALSVSDDEREAIYEAGWQEGGFKFAQRTFNDIAVDPRANETAAEFIRRKIRETVSDPDVAEKLVPVDHPFSSKRALIDTDYFETYNRDNVTLVDIRDAPIVEITPAGIRTTDGRVRARHHRVRHRLRRDDRAPTTRWTSPGATGASCVTSGPHGPQTYLGAAVAGFPNLLMITGPGSPSVLSNMPVSIEQHVEFYAGLIEHMDEHGYDTVEADERRRPSGSRTSTTWPRRRCSCSPTRGTSGPTSPASRGCSCPIPAVSVPTGPAASRSPPTAIPGFTFTAATTTATDPRRAVSVGERVRARRGAPTGLARSAAPAVDCAAPGQPWRGDEEHGDGTAGTDEHRSRRRGAGGERPHQRPT